MIKKTDKTKTITHLQSGNYIYRYVLVDRFKTDTKNHFGFDKKLELTEAEIFALVTPRKLRRKYITKKDSKGASIKILTLEKKLAHRDQNQKVQYHLNHILI